MANIAILTTFQDFNPGYSLTGIVEDQIKMLIRHGHNVFLYIGESHNKKSIARVQERYPEVIIIPAIPFAHLVDYQAMTQLHNAEWAKENKGDERGHDHWLTAEDTKDVLAKTFIDLGINYAFTHDFVFTGWNLPYAIGLQLIAKQNLLPGVRWFHWIHSLPSARSDWWQINNYGPKHKLVFPNKTDALQVAEQYNGVLEDVRVIPHIKDLRTWMNFLGDTCEIIDKVPGLMQADIVQVLPAGSDRLSAKRVDVVIKIFAEIKKQGKSVCLAIANQWATGRQRKETLEPFENLAADVGLKLGKEFVFTSDLDGRWANGLSREVLRELMMCANLFIFPTREESFGLVLPETSLSGGAFQVLNKSLQMQREVSGNNSLYFDFGSCHHEHHLADPQKYYYDIAGIILGRMARNEAVMQKTFYRQNNNYDRLYREVYGPLLMESLTWGNKVDVSAALEKLAKHEASI